MKFLPFYLCVLVLFLFVAAAVAGPCQNCSCGNACACSPAGECNTATAHRGCAGAAAGCAGEQAAGCAGEHAHRERGPRRLRGPVRKFLLRGERGGCAGE